MLLLKLHVSYLVIHKMSDTDNIQQRNTVYDTNTWFLHDKRWQQRFQLYFIRDWYQIQTISSVQSQHLQNKPLSVSQRTWNPAGLFFFFSRCCENFLWQRWACSCSDKHHCVQSRTVCCLAARSSGETQTVQLFPTKEEESSIMTLIGHVQPGPHVLPEIARSSPESLKMPGGRISLSVGFTGRFKHGDIKHLLQHRPSAALSCPFLIFPCPLQTPPSTSLLFCFTSSPGFSHPLYCAFMW